MGCISISSASQPKNKKVSSNLAEISASVDKKQSHSGIPEKNTMISGFEEDYIHPFDPFAEEGEMFKMEGSPNELLGYFKTVYESCDKIIVIFRLVKRRKPLLESFTKFLSLIKQTLLLNVLNQMELFNEKGNELINFNKQLENFCKYVEEVDLNGLNVVDENDPNCKNFMRNLGVIDKHFSDLNSALNLNPKAQSFKQIIEISRQFEGQLQQVDEKKKFFEAFRSTDCAEFWFVAIGQGTENEVFTTFCSAFIAYQQLRKAFTPEISREKIMNKLETHLHLKDKTIVTQKECEQFFIKNWLDHQQRRLFFLETDVADIDLKNNKANDSLTSIGKLELVVRDPGNSIFTKGTRFVYDGKILQEFDSKQNNIAKKSTLEIGTIRIGRQNDENNPDIGFPSNNNFISRNQCMIKTQHYKNNLLFTLMGLNPGNPVFFDLTYSHPLLIGSSLVFLVGTEVYMNVSEVFPEPFFYPEKNNSHILSVERFSDNKFIRTDVDKQKNSEQKAKLRLNFYKKKESEVGGEKSFEAFHYIEKECSLPGTCNFNIGSSSNADEVLKNASDISPFHFDVYFENNIGWYLKNRGESAGLRLFYSSFEEYVEGKHQVYPVVIKRGMMIGFGDFQMVVD